MSLFDKDLIKKDLSLEDILHEKITSRVESIVCSINERTKKGINVFNRATVPGTHGGFDVHQEWHDGYLALHDYVYASMNMLKRDLTNNPIICDKTPIYIDSIHVFNNYVDTLHKLHPWYVTTDCPCKICIFINCHKTVRRPSTGFLSFRREASQFEFDYNIVLEKFQEEFFNTNKIDKIYIGNI